MADFRQRQDAILRLVREREWVSTEELANHFDVTPQTIRKDLNDLCERGEVARVHGGATLGRGGTRNLEYERRRDMAAAEKEAIARLVAGKVPQRASLFINIGTTTEAVARALTRHEALMVVTNNFNVANILRVHPQHEVIVAGGVVRPTDGGIVGEAAVDFIRQFKVDMAIIGASAVDRDGALLDYDFREVRVARAIVENARRVVLAIDSTKFDRVAPVRIGHLADVDTVVADQMPAHVEKICHEYGVDVQVVEEVRASEDGI